jgi:hypothetical protein
MGGVVRRENLGDRNLRVDTPDHFQWNCPYFRPDNTRRALLNSTQLTHTGDQFWAFLDEKPTISTELTSAPSLTHEDWPVFQREETAPNTAIYTHMPSNTVVSLPCDLILSLYRVGQHTLNEHHVATRFRDALTPLIKCFPAATAAGIKSSFPSIPAPHLQPWITYARTLPGQLLRHTLLTLVPPTTTNPNPRWSHAMASPFTLLPQPKEQGSHTVRISHARPSFLKGELGTAEAKAAFLFGFPADIDDPDLTKWANTPWNNNTYVLLDDPGKTSLEALLKKCRITAEKGYVVLLVLGDPTGECAKHPGLRSSSAPPYSSAQFLQLDASALPYGTALGWRSAPRTHPAWGPDTDAFRFPAAAHPDVSPRGPTQAAPFKTLFHVFAPPHRLSSILDAPPKVLSALGFTIANTCHTFPPTRPPTWLLSQSAPNGPGNPPRRCTFDLSFHTLPALPPEHNPLTALSLCSWLPFPSLIEAFGNGHNTLHHLLPEEERPSPNTINRTNLYNLAWYPPNDRVLPAGHPPAALREFLKQNAGVAFPDMDSAMTAIGSVDAHAYSLCIRAKQAATSAYLHALGLPIAAFSGHIPPPTARCDACSQAVPLRWFVRHAPKPNNRPTDEERDLHKALKLTTNNLFSKCLTQYVNRHHRRIGNLQKPDRGLLATQAIAQIHVYLQDTGACQCPRVLDMRAPYLPGDPEDLPHDPGTPRCPTIYNQERSSTLRDSNTHAAQGFPRLPPTRPPFLAQTHSPRPPVASHPPTHRGPANIPGPSRCQAPLPRRPTAPSPRSNLHHTPPTSSDCPTITVSSRTHQCCTKTEHTKQMDPLLSHTTRAPG